MECVVCKQKECICGNKDIGDEFFLIDSQRRMTEDPIDKDELSSNDFFENDVEDEFQLDDIFEDGDDYDL